MATIYRVLAIILLAGIFGFAQPSSNFVGNQLINIELAKSWQLSNDQSTVDLPIAIGIND